MSDLISRTAKLVPYAKRPKNSAGFVTAFVYEPAADDAATRLGNLYVVVEVLASGRASEEVVDLIIQASGDKYYNEPDGELDPLARFEAAVKQTNHELSEYVGRGNAAWIGKLSAIMAVQAGRELHVAHTGSAEAFLYRGKAVSRITSGEAARPATPSKTFGSIATGELEEGDKILLATPALVHQVPLAKLQAVISSTSPNTAIAELSQLLEGADTNRIAAVVVDMTTPELAALKVRSDEPAEIELHGRESFTEAAIGVATPLAQTTAETSRRAAGAAAQTWQRLRPWLQSALFAIFDWLRRQLATKRGQRLAGAAAIILVVLLLGAWWMVASHGAAGKAFINYQALFARYTTAQSAASSGDKATARRTLADIRTQLTQLGSQEATINHALKNNPLAEGEPTSVKDFSNLVSKQIDALDGLVTATPMTVAEIGGRSGRPTHFESDGVRAYVIDAANHNAISIVNLQTGVQTDSKAASSALGDVKSTTLSAAGDGMFILTAKPSVWFYRFSNDSLIEQTLAYGTWPAASAIASYASNLYLLGDGTVYKHVRNAGGYSPKTDYISTTTIASGATSLAVDGWVYLVLATGLHQYLGPSFKQSAGATTSLTNISNLRSTAGGNVIIGTDTQAGRLAVWSAKTDKLTFDKQVALDGLKTLYDATYDPKLGKVFATAGNRLVSFNFQP